MSTDYQPGTLAIATVRGVEGVRVISCGKNGYHDFWWSPDYVIEWRQHEDRHVTGVRPLVVLDPADGAIVIRDWCPSGAHREGLLDLLREHYWSHLADQIEAQTKPPRIPEPGLWGVVEAHLARNPQRFTFVRTNFGWTNAGDGKGEALRDYAWESLIDPTLIREGVES